MPRKKSAMKEIKKSGRRQVRNLSIMSTLKSLIKKIEHLILEKKKEEAKTHLNELQVKIDKAAAKGIIHKNRASRTTSRLSRKIHLLFKDIGSGTLP